VCSSDLIAKSLAFPCPVEKTKPTMCTLARLVPVKGLERLIPILSRLKKEGLDFRHRIIGEGYQRELLERLIERHDLQDTVFLPGFHKNPFPFLKAADVFVSVSFVEGLPLVVCEALCLGKPIVATNNPGTAELLENGKYGYLVEPDDESVYRGLKDFLSNESLRNEYALKAKAGSGIDRFDLKKNICRINDLLKQKAPSVRTPLEQTVQKLFAHNDVNNDPGLMTGKMGKAIFFFHCARFTKNKLYEAYAFALIEEMTGYIHKETPVGYENGLSGIGAGLEYLVQNGFVEADTDEILEDIEQRIHLAIPYETDATTLADMGRYLLFRLRNPTSGDHKPVTVENKIFLIHVIDLIDRFYAKQSGKNLVCIFRFLKEADKTAIFPTKVKRLIREIRKEFASKGIIYRKNAKQTQRSQLETSLRALPSTKSALNADLKLLIP
jgi:hypothetical protein